MISILTPTRGRPDNVKRLIDSAFSTARFPEQVEFLFYVDLDDDSFPSELESSNVRVIHGPRMWLSVLQNILYANCNGEIVMYSGDELWDALDKTIVRYKLAGKEVYVLYSVPLGAEPRRCFERVPFLSQGCQLYRNLAISNEKNYREKLNQIVLKYQLKTIDPFNAFCGNEVCKVQDGSKLFYLDASHISNEGGRLVALSIKNELMNGLLNFQ
jgi:hypothetical protein